MEAITAIELAAERRLEAALTGEKIFSDAVQSFWELPLKARVVTVTRLCGEADPEDVKLTVEAIEWRNKAVHEGAKLPPDVRSKILALLRVACALLPINPAKLPEMQPEMSLQAPHRTSGRPAF